MPKTVGLALLLTLMATLPALAADKKKVIYHLADEDRVAFVLNNIRNHIDGVGGPQNVQIVLVMHGQVVKAFSDIDAVDKVRNGVKQLQADGVEVDVCANSLKVNKLAMSDMLPGLVEANAGGVVRIAELQGEGYVYIRP
jgi:intracellular sulfur oxidation DsrE/DsrF family protein